MSENDWWRGAVFYEIYPRSFQVSNGDGCGDLPGIIRRLGYVSSLGVDGIWLCPFYTSPMADNGYDISDYRSVDPDFGTMGDFCALLARAHELGLRVITDQVCNHTSNQHHWFLESREDRINEKADWYVWADARPDGTPPNNWQSVFGGPAWSFEPRRGQYYLHDFLPEQPKLNFHNDAVQAAVLDVIRFWLDKGVDGFRFDTINYYKYDRQLRNNPPKENREQALINSKATWPRIMQKHIYDISQPENLDFVRQLRKLLDEYPGTVGIGEISGDVDSVERSAEYSQPGLMHSCYNFCTLSGQSASANRLRRCLRRFSECGPGSWPSWAFSNHDVMRVMTRWGEGLDHHRQFACMLVALLCSLRGTILLYQGEELGLTEAEVPYDQIRDPFGRYLFPLWTGRDSSRTPMPWDKDAPNAGFTDGRPWLPIPEKHLALAVSEQEKDAASHLNFCRNFLRWRKQYRPLISGDIKFHDEDRDDILTFTRSDHGQSIYCVFNLRDEEKNIQPPCATKSLPYPWSEKFSAKRETAIYLPRYGFYFGRIAIEGEEPHGTGE